MESGGTGAREMGDAAKLFEGAFRQTAWVTNDMDAAIAMFARDYGAANWYRAQNRSLQTGPDAFALTHVALARRGGNELELIQPLGGADLVYAQGLKPRREGFHVCFHHICYMLPSREALESVRQAAQARGRAIVLSGSSETGTTYFYTDDRHVLGHYVEYIYCPQDYYDRLEAVIPVN
jgi:hypothetical protein